ncbi:hypothetical protein RHGRI_021608 [Rhododendron griersonianum]|uniref:Chaperone DnaJ C-terminal domain-containing protein n=1 Tax=Rhododendron griersonianum TaxID=479676 RepID=A0AAV6JM68_9ERIC|nr:hypothetical protein RHGRI_021608 [Rhododendron griersonianum]
MIVSSLLVFGCAICWTFNVECVTRYRWTLKSWSPDRVQLVAEDPIFARDGADVYVESNITFTQAIMGGKVVVPALSGKVEVKIPKGVQHGQLMKLRGKGLPRHGFLVDHGDQYVRFRINFPTLVNERQRAILEEFAKEEINHENSASSEGHWWQHILDRVMGPKFIVECSLFVLILLLLNKTML